MEMKNRMMDHMIPDDALNIVAGGAGNAKKTPGFKVGDWVCYKYDKSVVARITRREYDEEMNAWYYAVKFNDEGQELFWISESWMEKANAPT